MHPNTTDNANPTNRATKPAHYAVEAGLTITRNGDPFVNVIRSDAPYGARTVEADAFTRRAVACVNKLAGIADVDSVAIVPADALAKVRGAVAAAIDLALAVNDDGMAERFRAALAAISVADATGGAK